MVDRSVNVIVNSSSGAGWPPDRIDTMLGKFSKAGLQAKIEVLRDGADPSAAAKRAVARGASMVVAGGGDGTVSAVASALVETNTVLGVLPLGTLNHFAKDLSIPLDEDQAIANLGDGEVVRVDVGEVNGRSFINNSSLGLYPDIVRDRERRQHRLGRGKWRAFLEASITAARRYPVLSVRIDVDGKTYDRRTPFVFVGNNEYIMEGFEIGERRTIADGKLGLYVTQRTGRFGLLHLAFLALFKRLNQARDFDIVTAQDFVVHTHHRQLRVATDGEVTVMQTPLCYRTRPGVLRVIVPGRK